MTIEQQIDDCVHLILACGSALELADNITMTYNKSELSKEDDDKIWEWRKEIIRMAGIPDEYHENTNILDVAISDVTSP